jgi:hypothetical protein
MKLLTLNARSHRHVRQSRRESWRQLWQIEDPA